MKRALQFAFVLAALVVCMAQTTLVNLQTQVSGVLPTANGGLPSGAIVFIDTGSCPAGFTEQALAGKYALFTVAANSDVGTTGGSTAYTPAGTLNAVSAGTPAGTNATTTMAATGTKFTTSSSGTAALTALAGTTIASGTGNTITVPAETFTGSALATHNHTFTGTAATIQPSFVKLIACQKN